jgi:nucleoside-diphosphate-sugar epimerase
VTAPAELAKAAALVSADLRDADALVPHITGASIAFHCAAITRNSAPWRAHHETNVRGTEGVLRAAVKGGVAHVVHTSSVAVYGLEDRAAAVAETQPLCANPDPSANYLRSKVEAERVASAVASESGIGLSILRLGLLYGPGAVPSAARGIAQLGSWRLILGSGRNHLPFTYVANAIDAMLLAAAKSAPGIEAYNIVDGPPVTVRNAARVEERVRGTRVKLVPVPPRLLSIAASVAERLGRKDSAPPKLNRYVIRSATRNIVYDTMKARTRLGWESTVSLEGGLRRTWSLSDPATSRTAGRDSRSDHGRLS